MKKIVLLLFTTVFMLSADSLLVGAGGGYKKPISAVIDNLKKEGANIDGAFANLDR